MRVRRLVFVILITGCALASAQSDQPVSTPSTDARSFLCPTLTPDANGALSQEQMQQLLRVVADKDIENDKKLRDYTYIEREVQNKLDGKGQTKSTETKTYDILEVYGEQVQRLTEKDGQTALGKRCREGR